MSWRESVSALVFFSNVAAALYMLLEQGSKQGVLQQTVHGNVSKESQHLACSMDHTCSISLRECHTLHLNFLPQCILLS